MLVEMLIFGLIPFWVGALFCWLNPAYKPTVESCCNHNHDYNDWFTPVSPKDNNLNNKSPKKTVCESPQTPKKHIEGGITRKDHNFHPVPLGGLGPHWS